MESHFQLIKRQIESGHSAFIRDQIIAYIEDDPIKFKALMDLFFSDDWVINQRASWPVPLLVFKYPDLITPYLDPLIENLKKPSHNAVVRNTLRLLVTIDIPEKHQGILYDFCQKCLVNIAEPTANKIFGMTIMYNIAKEFPELLTELKLLIETQYPYEKPGYKSRARKTIALIEKLSE